jgi:hypothetical protein
MYGIFNKKGRNRGDSVCWHLRKNSYVSIWCDCRLWERDEFPIRAIQTEQVLRFPCAIFIFTPEELSVVESCENTMTVDSPATLAQVVRANEAPVSEDAPHHVNAVVCPQQIPRSH